MDCSTRFYLVRHGEVDADWQRRIYGDLDVPLSGRGQAQSADVARAFEGLALDAILSSGLARAEFAAGLIRADRGNGPGREPARRDEPELREIHRGSWAGLNRDQLEERWPGRWEEWIAQEGLLIPPLGETQSQLRKRVIGALNRLCAEFSGKRVMIVAHLWVLRAAVCHALGLPVGMAPRLDVPYSGLVTLDWELHPSGSRARLISLGTGEPEPGVRA